jgi:protein involved in polysaccharide export with SLBB domain
MRRGATIGVMLFVGAALTVASGLRSAAQDRAPNAAKDQTPRRQPDEKAGAGQAEDGAAPADSDRVRPGDLLIRTVADLAGPGEYVKPVRVGADGTVPRLAHVEKPLKVEGLTLAEVEAAVASAMRDDGMMQQASVWVDRMERAEAATVEPGPIKPGDVVRFSVVDLLGPGVEQVRNLHVSEAGNIGLPVLGQTKVAGLTEAEAEAAVRRAYREKGVIEHTLVSVLRIKLPPGPEPIPTGTKVDRHPRGG